MLNWQRQEIERCRPFGVIRPRHGQGRCRRAVAQRCAYSPISPLCRRSGLPVRCSEDASATFKAKIEHTRCTGGLRAAERANTGRLAASRPRSPMAGFGRPCVTHTLSKDQLLTPAREDRCRSAMVSRCGRDCGPVVRHPRREDMPGGICSAHLRRADFRRLALAVRNVVWKGLPCRALRLPTYQHVANGPGLAERRSAAARL
jgi:hypothetical protein